MLGKSHIKIVLVSLLITLGISSISRAQVNVTSGTAIPMTPTEFIQNYLVGTGVTVTNATFNGSSEMLSLMGTRVCDMSTVNIADQIGIFTATGEAFGQLKIAGGIILAAGKVEDADLRNVPNAHASTAMCSGADPDLAILGGGDSKDRAVLEFDFIPQTDNLSFRYVFASEEFDDFCSGGVNDSFGFFLSSSDISGGMGYTNDAVNIALLPNSLSPVTINNICSKDYHVLTGDYSWWNGDGKEVPPYVKGNGTIFTYDRFTKVFTASYSVNCGQTYHIKIAISDIQDMIFDSGIFLEQNSFSSTSTTPSTTFSNPETGELLVPGCSTTDLIYTIPEPKTATVTVDLTIDPSGTATQADILPNPFPAHLYIPTGMTQTPAIHIEALPAAFPGPDKTLIITATVTNCAVANVATSTFTIKYNDVLSVTAPPVTICSGGTATLTATAFGGQVFLPSGSYHFLWSTGSTSPTTTVNPGPGSHPYTVNVTDACGASVTITTWVQVGTTPGPAGPLTGPTVLCTPANDIVFSIPEIPGAEDYIWTLPPGAMITAGNNSRSIMVNFPASAASGNISVYGHSTFCGDGSPATLALDIHPSPQPAGAITGPIALCQGIPPVSYSIQPLNYTTQYNWSVPPGVTITSGAGTSQITCLVTTSAVSGSVTVYGFNPECLGGVPATLTITIDPIPGSAGMISSPAGAVVCQRQDGVSYSITPIPHAESYIWTYSGTGVTLHNNGPDLLIDFSATATSGILSVAGHNNCGNGTLSPAFAITVRTKPVVEFHSCTPLVTTKNGRPILLKGGTPLGTGGEYSGTGVTLVSPGIYVFDPTNGMVSGGTVLNPGEYPVTFRYTNVEGCYDEKTITFTVYPSNATGSCPGTLTDYRDSQVYSTFLAGTGAGANCWMAVNLNYGDYSTYSQLQTDNCTPEKYCKDNILSNCSQSGGYYQWAELMMYQENTAYQDLCPPGWHLPSASEWESLITFYSGVGKAGSPMKDLHPASGFHGLPEGILYQNNSWSFTTGTLTGSLFWTSSSLSPSTAVARGINSTNPSVSYYPSSKAHAFPVRCVRN